MRALAMILCGVTATMAQDRSAYVSLASHIVGTHTPASREHSPSAMANAGKLFIVSLYDAQRTAAVHDLKSSERRAWTNLPARPDAGGVRLGDLNEAQLRAFCNLMATLFSEQGYLKMRNIMLADDQLLPDGAARPGFGTENFSVVIFGMPSNTKPWAFQLDGHHVGVNVAIHGEKLTMSPSFIGTQPEAFQLATQQIRPLAGEVDHAFKLANSLSDEQRKSAILGPKRGRIQTGPGHDNRVPTPQGVSCSTFNDAQKKALLVLISQWVNDLPAAQATQRMKQIEAELDRTRFGWYGPSKAVSDVSYVIQGPSLIIEYACQDIGGNPVDHLHTMYRNPTNEYGGQIPSAR